MLQKTCLFSSSKRASKAIFARDFLLHGSEDTFSVLIIAIAIEKVIVIVREKSNSSSNGMKAKR